jgi:hypothetical protein
MHDPSAPAGLSSPPDPATDRPGKLVPQNIADMLALLHILLTYARHLAATIERRAASRGFASIGQYFGTARLPVILARLQRGMLRIAALERVLLVRAARGRDLVFREFHVRTRRAAPAREPQPQVPPADPAAAAPKPVRRKRDAAPDPANLPTLDQLIAQIRRRPIGQTVADICRDLGVWPLLCDHGFWTDLSHAITRNRGNLLHFVRDFRRREVDFVPEWDFDPNLGLPEQTRSGVHRVLGFFIGETPVTPYWVAAAPGLGDPVATGPP